MNKLLLTTVCAIMLGAATTQATEATTTASTEIHQTEVRMLTWNEQVQKKYNLTEAEVKTLTDAKLSQNETIRVAHLSRLSEKPIEDVLKMRQEQKMGWGKMAKELGVHPSEIGKSISSFKKERKEQYKEHKEKHREHRKERRDHKESRHEMKKEMRKEMKERKEEKRKDAYKYFHGSNRNQARK